MWEQYAPEPRMRLNLGIRRRLAPLLDNDRRKIELANSLLFTLPGSPIIYYGDEIGMGDNIWLDDRNGVRTPMQWENTPNAGFTNGKPFTEFVHGDLGYEHVNVAAQRAEPGSLFHSISRMVNIRKQHHAFGRGSMEWVITDNPTPGHVHAQNEGGNPFDRSKFERLHSKVFPCPSNITMDYIDLLSNVVRYIDAGLTLQPYEYLWLKRK